MMGGKSEVINYRKMAELYSEGCDNISDIEAAVESIGKKIAMLRNSHIAGEKGVSYRYALNSIYVALNGLSRSAEKAAVFMDLKLNAAKTVQTDSAAKNKTNHVGLKK